MESKTHSDKLALSSKVIQSSSCTELHNDQFILIPLWGPQFGLDKLQIMPGCPCLGGWQIVKIHLSFSILRLLMLLLRLYTDLSVCSAIVGASYAGAPCPGALVANLSKSQLSQVDFKCVCECLCVMPSNQE